MRGQGGSQPLRRSQSARVPIQGHSRQRSMGRCEISQPFVAFSSSIVSACISLFEFASDLSWGEIGDDSRAWKRTVYKPWIALKVAALGLVYNLNGFCWACTSLLISNVQCLEIERFLNGIIKSLPTKPVFPCGNNWFELRSLRSPGWECWPQLIMSPTPSLYTHPCAEAQ